MSRSKHSLSHYHLTTANMGQCIPIGVTPVLPGDTLGHQTNTLLRVSPLAAPVMHQVDVRTHHFYVANRTIWEETDSTPGWESFITGGEDGMNTDQVPTLNSTAGRDLLDHMGVPRVAGIPINALPVRAFNFIWNEFYRDQDLQAKRVEHDTSIPNVAWEKDYLTTCRPWSQKGPQVSIPVAGTADVVTDLGTGGVPGVRSTSDGVPHYLKCDIDPHVTISATGPPSPDRLYVDLANATGADPLDIREAWGLQRFMENAARFGSRYPEKMRQLGSHYKGLMDRPVFLGGGSKAINFSEVLQTANDTNDRAFGVGDMYGHGIAATRSNKYAKRIDEHGYIITILSCRPKALYQDGIHREWIKQDREDFHDPFLDFVGQQEVYNNEVYFNATDGDQVFGYSDRYDEYRQGQNLVTAEFRNILDYWHLARQFGATPTPNDTFVECVPSKRIFNEQASDSLWIMSHHKIAAHRNIPKRATARLI